MQGWLFILIVALTASWRTLVAQPEEPMPVDTPWESINEVGIVSTNHRGADGQYGKAFGQFEFEGNSSNGRTSEGSKFQKEAAKLGLDISTVSRNNGRKYHNQDAYLMELIMAGPEGDERPVVGIFGVLDGHGDYGQWISQWGVDAIVHSIRAIFQRQGSLPDFRDRPGRIEAMRRNMREIFAHATAEIDAMSITAPFFMAAGSTISVVLWDFEGNFLVVGSMGDSPAYAKFRDVKTNETEIRLIYTDQGLDSYKERRRTVDHLRQKHGLVPVAKYVAGETLCNIIFGPASRVKSNKTTVYVREPGSFIWMAAENQPGSLRRRLAAVESETKTETAWTTEAESSTFDGTQTITEADDDDDDDDDDEDDEDEEDLLKKRFIIPPKETFGHAAFDGPENPRYMFVVDGMNPRTVTGLTGAIFYMDNRGPNIDYRMGLAQLATSLGHRGYQFNFSSDLFRIRDPAIDFHDLEGKQLEYMVVASDGLTTPLHQVLKRDLYVKHVLQCNRTDPESNCLPDLRVLFNMWTKAPTFFDKKVDELYDLMCEICENRTMEEIDTAIQQEIAKTPESPNLAQALETLAVTVYNNFFPPGSADDITIMVIRPNERMKKFEELREQRRKEGRPARQQKEDEPQSKA